MRLPVSLSKSAARVLGVLFAALSFAVLVACAGTKKKDDGHEKLVPEETQQKSGELSGRQQMMGDFNASPADQAAARHEDRTRPVEREKPEKK